MVALALKDFCDSGLQEEAPLTPEEAEAKDTQAKRDVFANLNLHTLRYGTRIRHGVCCEGVTL